MKRLLPVLATLALAATAAAQTPTKVFSTNCENSSALNGSPWANVTPPYDYHCRLNPAAMIAGNSIVVSLGADLSGGNQSWAVSDDKGDNFSKVVSSSTLNNRGLMVFYASNIAGGESDIDVRLTGGGLNGYWEPTVAEFMNTGSVDGSGCSTGSSSTSIASASLTPTVTGDLLYQVSYYPNLVYGPAAQSSSYTAGSNSNISWSLWLENLPDGSAGQWGVYNSTAAITPTMTAASAQNYISCALALKPASAGGTQSSYVIDHERMALAKNGPNPLKVAMNATGTTVVVTYLSNDQPSPTSCCAISSSPALTWTQTGAFGCMSGGVENCAMVYCAQSSTPIGQLLMTINRAGSSHDGIFHIFDLRNVSCTVDFDTGASNGVLAVQGSVNSGTTIDLCASSGLPANCMTPTVANDFVVGETGEYWGTITSIGAPSWMDIDSSYFTGNTVDGYTQTDENNGFFYGTDPNTSAFTVKTGGVYSGGSSVPAGFGGRVAGLKPLSVGPAPPYGLTGVVK